jgi:Histidine kinase-, DNA gyrase B-, and HSP90-like ATPase
MKVNIKRAIKSISETISFYQPLYESIVNSFQANATKIEINFELNDDKVIGYSIKDNGVGYTSSNLDSFLELWSDYKIEKFALGSGRILCLKVFDNIVIESQTKNFNENEGKKVNINFNRNFTANSIQDADSLDFENFKRITHSSQESYTLTKFENIHDEYQKQYEKEITEFSIDDIKEDITIKLLPMFISFEKDEKEFEIYLDGDLWLNKENLANYFNTLDFQDDHFEIEKDLSIYDDELTSKTYTFNLKYRITEDDRKILTQFYGAADRYICKFPKKTALAKLDNGYSGIFCLTSDYFNTRVKDSRNAFVISMNQSNTTIDNPVSFPEINKKLEEKLNNILRENFENIDEELQDKKENIVTSFPHLARYVDKITNLTMSESDMQKEAEEAYRDETKNIRKELETFTNELKRDKNSFNERKYRDITQHFTLVGREQLADYIGYRQTIIDMLLEIYTETQEDSSLFNEESIHELFMPLGTSSEQVSYYANNVWIFDDKFMSYNYAASEITIATIVSNVTGKDRDEVIEHHRRQKPDLAMFYSDPEGDYRDVLLIEFKRLNHDLDGKKKAIIQLQDYPMYIRKNIENVRSVYSYTIIDIDEPFREWLVDSQRFKENAFGDSDNNISAYYDYNPSVKAHLNVVSFNQVLQDANKRNKVFLDILIENFENQ